ncbi:hypothetical protein SK128_002939 [Halocaridina rubra]|uniref:Uncharacterized protein n=1 Tax=Halocaridina rubra TaxID=373956 RepID=A0AAN8WX01_HALRR
MKALLILLASIAFAAGAPSSAKEEHDVKKRSPDDDIYFYPSASFGSVRAPSFRTGHGFGTGGSSFQMPLRYFMDFDDIFDDRRKREALPTNRQKRAADFDDDDFYWFPRTSVRTYGTQPIARTSFLRPFGRFFVDYDDLFEDRRKRQITAEDTKRQKRSADFDDDDEFYYYTSPVTTYSVAPVAARTAAFATGPAVTPFRTVYYSVDDDDDHDRKKRSAGPDDDDDDDFRIVYTYTQPRTFVQTRTVVQPRPVAYSPVSYVTYDFDDKK